MSEQNPDLEFPGRDVEHLEPRHKHTVSSIYDKVSDWSLSTKKGDRLRTGHEKEHESLMNEYRPSSPSPPLSYDAPAPSPSSPPPPR